MRWVAPTEKDAANELLGKRLWDAADQFRANCELTCLKCGGPPASNANFAWVQDIIHHLAATGSAGLMLANRSISFKAVTAA